MHNCLPKKKFLLKRRKWQRKLKIRYFYAVSEWLMTTHSWCISNMLWTLFSWYLLTHYSPSTDNSNVLQTFMPCRSVTFYDEFPTVMFSKSFISFVKWLMSAIHRRSFVTPHYTSGSLRIPGPARFPGADNPISVFFLRTNLSHNIQTKVNRVNPLFTYYTCLPRLLPGSLSLPRQHHWAVH